MTAKANTKTVPAPKNSADKEIVITRVFNAPRALVYRAWTNPVHLARWWGPRGFTNPRCEIDVRAGGVIRIDMRAPNGTVYPMAGIFLELKEPEQIIFTSGALDEKGVQLFEFLHTVNFSEKNGKTTLVIRSRVVKTTADAAKYIGGFEAGMGQSLDKLADDLVHQGEPLVLERTFNAPSDRVWHALTNHADFKNWYFDLPDFKAQVGFEFEFSGGCDGGKYQHLCRITEVIPGKKLAYTWRYQGYEGDSLVTFELFPEGAQTRLKLTHEGLNTFPKDPHFAAAKFQEGWTAIIGTGLKAFVEKNSADIAARSLIISRVVDAPRELVWEAMSNPKHVVHWWGPRGFSTATEIHEFRVGGEWKHVMQGPDGAKYPNYSVFQEIVKPERIVYQHSGKREDGPAISKLFTWTFEVVDGGKTKVTINMLFPTADERNFVVKEFGALEGGKQTLERLDEFLVQTKK